MSSISPGTIAYKAPKPARVAPMYTGATELVQKTPDAVLNSVHCTEQCTLYLTVYTVLNSVHCTEQCTLYLTLYTVLNSVHCTLQYCTVYSAVKPCYTIKLPATN